tara:strand:- start:354 stop:1439 length:1086 start_codon:yes stop_codon:yes gene_type:complete
MNKLKKINLMISTDSEGQGGIATVILGYRKEKLIDDLAFTLINTHSSANTNNVSAIAQFLFSLIKITFYGVFNNLGIAHIHMASRGSYTRKSIILRLAKFFGAKTVIHLHGAEFETFYNEECSESKKQHIRNTFNIADRIIVLSSQWLKWVHTIVTDKNKVCVVYNAVPELNLPKKNSRHKNILFLGRLGQRKGVEDLINAFAQIASNFPHAQLQLGGDGDVAKYQAQVTKLGITKQVSFLGWIEGAIKNQYLADATIYCLPSYNEGFPMGILEAMSAEVAVIASTTGGIPDAITNNKEGLLVEAGDVNALGKALTIMLSDDNQREKYITAAKVKFQNNFTHHIIIPQLKGIYKELLENKK